MAGGGVARALAARHPEAPSSGLVTPRRRASSSCVSPSRSRAGRIRPGSPFRCGSSPDPRTVSIAGQRPASGTLWFRSHMARLWYQQPSSSARVCCVSPRSIRRWRIRSPIVRGECGKPLGNTRGRGPTSRRLVKGNATVGVQRLSGSPSPRHRQRRQDRSRQQGPDQHPGRPAPQVGHRQRHSRRIGGRRRTPAE